MEDVVRNRVRSRGLCRSPEQEEKGTLTCPTGQREPEAGWSVDGGLPDQEETRGPGLGKSSGPSGQAVPGGRACSRAAGGVSCRLPSRVAAGVKGLPRAGTGDGWSRATPREPPEARWRAQGRDHQLGRGAQGQEQTGWTVAVRKAEP